MASPRTRLLQGRAKSPRKAASIQRKNRQSPHGAAGPDEQWPGSGNLSDPRIRFNGGFHDARYDKNVGIPRRTLGGGGIQGRFPLPHWSRAYVDGYNAGWSSDHADTTSDRAWKKTYPHQKEFA